MAQDDDGVGYGKAPKKTRLKKRAIRQSQRATQGLPELRYRSGGSPGG